MEYFNYFEQTFCCFFVNGKENNSADIYKKNFSGPNAGGMNGQLE